MKRYWLMAVGLALVLSVVGLCGCTAGTTTVGTVDLNSQQGIWVSGEGEVTVTPDIATLWLGIEAKADTVAEAQSQAAEAMDAVMAALADNGVDENDIQTQYFSIYQDTRWDSVKDEEVEVGYEVTNMVTAKIREIDEIGPIIDAVAAAGRDYTRISNISFSVDDPTPYYDEARQEAMADARDRAEQLAELAGVILGEPFYISEGVQASISRSAYYEGVMAPAPVVEYPTSISPGEMELALTVQVAYAILD
jgi:uncharacterized protein YggE